MSEPVGGVSKLINSAVSALAGKANDSALSARATSGITVADITSVPKDSLIDSVNINGTNIELNKGFTIPRSMFDNMA